MELSPGLTASVELIVADTDTAAAFRSGDVPVLATPRVVALVEEATVACLSPLLDSGLTTVGTRVEVEHLLPTVVGESVIARARLDAVDGRRLAFVVWVSSGEAEVARGRVERVVVDRVKFLARAAGT